MESPADSSVDLVNVRLPLVGYLDLDVVPLVAGLHNVWANMVVSVTGMGDSTAAFLTDNEVPYLGILDIVTNTGNAWLTVDGLVLFFGHLEAKQIPSLFNKQQCK